MSETVVTGSDRNKVYLFKMLRSLALCVALLCLPARAQPVSCKEDAHCSDGYYCETDANICRECLSCEDLKRVPPLAINTCIKFIAQCGSCINELVMDRRGDMNVECVPPDPSQLEPMPSSVWRLIGIGVLLFLALVVSIIAYLLRYPEIFKIAASSQSRTVTARITATAPDAPPPYNQLPQSPYHLPPYSDVEPTAYNEDEQFIKRSPSSRPRDARESAGNHAARVYNKPLYTPTPRLLVLCVALLCLPARAQPVSCREDAHCSDGYYCETDANICRECLSCEDLKREPPLAMNTCIKSVAECGSCIKELVVDRHGDVNAECVPPDPSQLEPTPSYVWMLIGIGVLLFLALVVGIIAYLLRYPEIFKTAGSNQSSTVTARITATAPEAPPPYNPLPQSPYRSPPYSDVEPTAYNEDEQFIKRSSSSRPQDARESAGNQAARVFNKPLYERDPPTPSAESPVPEYTESMTLPIHDEDTMPSPWIPGTTSNGDVNANVVNDNNANESEGAGAALPALLSAARDTTLVEHSAAKKRCVRQDSRESNCGDSSHSSFPRSPSPSAGGPPYSFITQITNVVQINTSK